MARQTKLEANLKGFHEKLHQVVAVSKKTFATELNRRMLQLCVGAKGVKGLVQLTQKATEAEIRADLSKEVVYRLPGGRVIGGPLGRVLAIQWLTKNGETINAASITAAEQRIIAARVKSRAYIAASWLFSAFKLASRVPGNSLTRTEAAPTWDPGTAANAQTKTRPASEQSLRSTIFNTARGASKIAAKVISRALANAIKDMGKYIGRKWGEAYARKKRGV